MCCSRCNRSKLTIGISSPLAGEAIAQQWGGEGYGAVAHSPWQPPPPPVAMRRAPPSPARGEGISSSPAPDILAIAAFLDLLHEVAVLRRPAQHLARLGRSHSAVGAVAGIGGAAQRVQRLLDRPVPRCAAEAQQPAD